MKICIKNPAPLGPNLTRWGDYHFGQSLQRALERKGATVRQSYWPEWHDGGEDDVVIVLRGKRKYAPERDRTTILWVMSHPATVSVEELDQYSLVYVASETFAKMLDGATTTPIEVMRQCTDPSMFNLNGAAAQRIDDRRDVIFVANSRGIRRDMVRWAASSGVPLKLYGRHWKSLGLGQFLQKEYVENEDLPALYRSTRLSLNDHWGDMSYFGIINNRIFDCLFCGVPVLTDSFPEMREVFGESLLYADSSSEFSSAIRRFTLRYPEVAERSARVWERIASEYTFDARAEQLLQEAVTSPGRSAPSPGKRPEADPAPYLSMLREVESFIQSKRGVRDVQVLHMFPSPSLTQALFAMDGIGYMSAGFGAGAWHVRLEKDVEQIAERFFDVILIEDASALSAMTEVGRQCLVDQVFRRLKAGGNVITGGAAPPALVIDGGTQTLVHEPVNAGNSATRIWKLSTSYR